MRKPQPGDLIKVSWSDINSDSGWEQEWELEPAVCVSYGIFYGIENDSLRLYGSYNEKDKGDRTVIPMSVVKKITIIKHGVRKTDS